MAFAFETCIPAMFRHFSGLGTCKTSFALDVMSSLVDELVTSHVRYCIQMYGNCNVEMLGVRNATVRAGVTR